MFKSLFVYTILLFLIPCCVKAQLQLGAKAGINISNIALKEAVNQQTNYRSSIGMNIGFFADIRLMSKFSLAPAVSYTQRGYQSPPGVVGRQHYIDLVINYIELPVLVSYSPIKFMAIDIGPNVAVKLFSYNRTNNASFQDSFNDFDFGISGGLRFNIINNWFVMARYYHGIRPIREIDTMVDGRLHVKGSTYNQSFQFSVAYSLFKKEERSSEQQK